MLWRKNLERLFIDVEMEILPALKDIEIYGIGVDSGYLKNALEKIRKATQRLEKQVKKVAGEDFNINSPAQLAKVIFYKLKLPTQKRTRRGRLSTDKSTLAGLARSSPFVRKVIECRKAKKLISGFLTPLLAHVRDNRLYPLYSQTHSPVGMITCRIYQEKDL